MTTSGKPHSFAVLLSLKLEICVHRNAGHDINYFRKMDKTHQSGRIIYDLSKHDNLSCNNFLHEMSSKSWMAQFRSTLGRDQRQVDCDTFGLWDLSIQRGLGFVGILSLILLSFRATFSTALLDPFNPNSCYVVLQSICLNGSLENISTGNEADVIIWKRPLNHHLKK